MPKKQLGDDIDPTEILLHGQLEVMRIRVDNCLDIDYKGAGFSDPFCVVIANTGKTKDGDMIVSSQMTVTIWDSNCPRWSEQFSFHFLWYKVEDLLLVEMKRLAVRRGSMRGRKRPTANKAKGGAHSTNNEVNEESASRIVGQLQADTTQLMSTVPKIQEELKEVRKDMQLILDALKRKRSNTLVHSQPDNMHRRPKEEFGFDRMERPLTALS